MEDDWIVACITRKKEKGLELLIDQYEEYRNDKDVTMLRFIPYVSDYENDSSKDLTSDAFNLKMNNN
ncbi:hypothetical protein SFC34_19800 [Priestia aryabhattai]|uniref:hypothetical protein n=1 Tax=Priestia aryabhattai TaxID=412384 RepID=UPI0008DDB1E0|nr:hypothetical protein [Priestia aryabhattai]MDH3113486.1 hypothetical protein [Priestia aryabhattai]MDH3127610.1 hypothetical protein [Priestia aryabhattai]MED4156203.1 hypothetical protein [Priestia aryabhattai]OHY75332.1 hypothetical protein BCV52_11335 [Priestia aryabhattai]